MTRNLERRVEIATPVLSEKIKKEIINYLLVLLSDDVKTRFVHNDGIYRRKENLQNLNSQVYFFEKAYENATRQKSTVKTEQVGFFTRLFDKFKK
jgi:polyphosphate kinase